MLDLPWWCWAIAVVLIALVAGRFLYDRTEKRRIAGQAAEDAELEAQQASWRERWDMIEAEMDRQIEAIENDPETPPYVISLLMQDAYPRYGVFRRTVGYQSHERRQEAAGGRIYYAPPDVAPTPSVQYLRATQHTFETEDLALEWLERFVDIPGRQSAYDESPINIGQYGAMDVEAEAGKR
jgi:hypothetical protein